MVHTAGNGHTIISGVSVCTRPRYVTTAGLRLSRGRCCMVSATPVARIRDLVSAVAGLCMVSSTIPLILVFSLFFVVACEVTGPLGDVSRTTGTVTHNSFSGHVPIADSSRVNSLTVSFGVVAGSLTHLRAVQEDFIKDISRRLHAPVAAVSNFVSNVLSNAVPRRGRRCCLSVISDRMGQLSHLIGNVLSVTGLRTNRIRLGHRDFCFSRVLYSVIVTRRRHVRGGDLRVRKLSDLSRVGVSNSHSLLRRMICGLISGTVGFASRGNGVDFSLGRRNRGLIFAISGANGNVTTGRLPFIFRHFCGTSGSHSSVGGDLKLKLCLMGAVISTRGNRTSIADGRNRFAAFGVVLSGKRGGKGS